MRVEYTQHVQKMRHSTRVYYTRKSQLQIIHLNRQDVRQLPVGVTPGVGVGSGVGVSVGVGAGGDVGSGVGVSVGVTPCVGVGVGVSVGVTPGVEVSVGDGVVVSVGDGVVVSVGDGVIVCTTQELPPAQTRVTVCVCVGNTVDVSDCTGSTGVGFDEASTFNVTPTVTDDCDP